MSEPTHARYESGSVPMPKPNGFGGVDPQHETRAGIPAPTTPTKIKTMPQAEEPVGSSKIKTLSPALAKAKNAKKGFSAPAGISSSPLYYFSRENPSLTADLWLF